MKLIWSKKVKTIMLKLLKYLSWIYGFTGIVLLLIYEISGYFSKVDIFVVFIGIGVVGAVLQHYLLFKEAGD